MRKRIHGWKLLLKHEYARIYLSCLIKPKSKKDLSVEIFDEWRPTSIIPYIGPLVKEKYLVFKQTGGTAIKRRGVYISTLNPFFDYIADRKNHKFDSSERKFIELIFSIPGILEGIVIDYNNIFDGLKSFLEKNLLLFFFKKQPIGLKLVKMGNDIKSYLDTRISVEGVLALLEKFHLQHMKGKTIKTSFDANAVWYLSQIDLCREIAKRITPHIVNPNLLRSYKNVPGFDFELVT